MDLIELLQNKEDEIVDQALDSMMGSQLRHYEKVEPAKRRERLKTLYDVTLKCIVTMSMMPMVNYADKIAQQRFWSGYSLQEVQTTFNVLEESIWNRILAEMQPSESAKAVMLLNNPLRVGKDMIAEKYLSLLSESHSASLDAPADLTAGEIE